MVGVTTTTLAIAVTTFLREPSIATTVASTAALVRQTNAQLHFPVRNKFVTSLPNATEVPLGARSSAFLSMNLRGSFRGQSWCLSCFFAKTDKPSQLFCDWESSRLSGPRCGGVPWTCAVRHKHVHPHELPHELGHYSLHNTAVRSTKRMNWDTCIVRGDGWLKQKAGGPIPRRGGGVETEWVKNYAA